MSSLSISILVNCVLSIILLFSIFYNFKFGVIILSVQDTIESALDEIDESYKRMSLILEKPIFFDSVEVRQVIAEISKTRDMILNVAKSLTNIEKKS